MYREEEINFLTVAPPFKNENKNIMSLLYVSEHSKHFLKPVKKLGLGWPPTQPIGTNSQICASHIVSSVAVSDESDGYSDDMDQEKPIDKDTIAKDAKQDLFYNVPLFKLIYYLWMKKLESLTLAIYDGQKSVKPASMVVCVS